MRKATSNKMSGIGWLPVASLALTLAAFGCSSNQYAGNGQPTAATPTINSVNHSGTTGSSYGTEGMPPMSSSYSNPTAPRVDVDALATLAAQRGFRGVILGPSDPGGVQQGVTVASGQFDSPANAVMPQSTVNSSINSQPTPAITGGDVSLATASGATAGGSSVTGVAAATTPTTVNTTGAAATTGTTAATSALTSSTGAAPTVASSAAFSPVLMNSTPAPQATGTTGPTLRTVGATAGRGKIGATTTSAARTTTAKASAVRTAGTANVGVTSGIQIQTNAKGAITVTNMATAAPAAKGK